MGLEVEDVEAGECRKPIASYVPDDCQDWLRQHRVELNAMTTPQFLAWLDARWRPSATASWCPPQRCSRTT